MFTAPVVEQVEMFVPAIAVAGWYMVIVFVEVAVPHGAFPVAVNVKVTVPEEISAALGV